MKILDVGSGGNDRYNFRPYPLADVYVDLNPPKHPIPNFYVADIRNLPFKSNSFDLVVCRHVLEHVPNFIKALLELIRVSRKTIYIVVPHRYYRPQDPDHKHFWRKKDWIKILNKLIEKNIILSYEIETKWTLTINRFIPILQPTEIHIWIIKNQGHKQVL